MRLRTASADDLASIQALQNKLAPERRRMSLDVLKDTFFAASHDHGRQTCAAFHEDSLQGICGWVRGREGEFFVSPFFAESLEASELLASKALVEAIGSKWARVSCFPEEVHKKGAFSALGFHREFDFVEFECKPRIPNAPNLPLGITEVSLTDAEPALFREIMNLSFAGVDNSLPISEEQAKETIHSEILDARLSLLWKNSVGRYTAFTVVNQDGYVDAIGIHPEAQKLGYGTLLYKRTIAFAAEKKMARLYTTVSSRNYGSLSLHAKLGIPEVERRVVMQKNLGA